MRCGRCGGLFSPGDAVELTPDLLPSLVGRIVAAFWPQITPHLTRVLANECKNDGCRGLVTILYLKKSAYLFPTESKSP